MCAFKNLNIDGSHIHLDCLTLWDKGELLLLLFAADAQRPSEHKYKMFYNPPAG